MGWIVQFLPETQSPQETDGDTALPIDGLLSRIWDLGTTGIGELASGHMVAGFETESEASAAEKFLRSQSVTEVDRKPVNSQGWHDPDKISEVTVPAAAGDISFSLQAKASFGHGDHETTRLVLDELDQNITIGNSILDLGTGSGVLAIAAIKLGAGSVVAIDLDSKSIATATANAEANDVEVTCRATPVHALVEEFTGHFDLVVANVLLVAHRDVAQAVLKVLKPDGHVITSGYLPGQSNEVADAYRPLRPTSNLKLGPWVGHVFGPAEEASV